MKRPKLWRVGVVLVLFLGLAGLAVYFAMSPSSQVYGAITTNGPRDAKVVALTFDDGPNDPWTLRIADVLDAQGVKGMFFLVGMNVDRRPDIARTLVQRGHLVGNHSYNHQKRKAIFQPRYTELSDAEKSISKATGMCPAYFRTPNGFHTPWQLHAISSAHLHTVGWDVNPNDWRMHDSAALATSVVSSARPGSIILLHDGEDTRAVTDRSTTLSALPDIITGLKAKGYRFVRLDELLGWPAYLSTCAGKKAVA